MQTWSPSSFFRDVSSRELSGFRARKRPCFTGMAFESGVVTIEHDGVTTPPLAVSFCKSSRNSHTLAVTDEDGHVSLYNTRRKLPSLANCREKTGESRVHDWIAHENAIFDICWMKDDTHILTASGDQTIRIWNVERRVCTGLMTGHTGSVKSLCSHHSNQDLVVSGSRDGSFAMWDLRCNPTSKNSSGEACICSTAIVENAHGTSLQKRTRRGKAASRSITSVLYLNDEISIASAGAGDSVVKFWDTRNLKCSITQTSPCFKPTIEKGKSSHGVSSLSQDLNGTFLAASCMDNMVYLYDMLHLENGPVKTFSGCEIGSFYVKAAISPDAAHILSGSSDGNAYIWQVDMPEAPPLKLEGHEGEVTAVDWCSSEIGKMATSSDDFMVRVWNMKKDNCTSTRSPTTIRKRVTVTPTMECRILDMDEAPTTPSKRIDKLNPLEQHNPNSSIQGKMSEFSTPESANKRRHSDLHSNQDFEMQKTPEQTVNSPSSVLNPPPSLKRRTIRDYFLAAS